MKIRGRDALSLKELAESSGQRTTRPERGRRRAELARERELKEKPQTSKA
jgi:hypothetical protein